MGQDTKNNANQQGVNIQSSLGVVPPNNVVVQSMTSMSGPSKCFYFYFFSLKTILKEIENRVKNIKTCTSIRKFFFL